MKSPWSTRSFALALTLTLAGVLRLTADPAAGEADPSSPPPPPRAARSVHLGWQAPDADAFYLELAVDESTAGSYFMACGWNTGYFGVQELARGRKVALFSVWDSSQGDDPGAVKPEDRVELLHEAEGVRIRRFGGEGTGGQCMMDFDWAPGQTNRFLVSATVQSNRTAYAGWLWQPASGVWKHLVTFRTRTGGQPLKGLYSFVEDFRRDGQSVQDVRRARFFNGWVRPWSATARATPATDASASPAAPARWTALDRARFTASNAPWEARDNIDAGLAEGQFHLATGGATVRRRELRSLIVNPQPSLRVPADLPEP